jgi:hypothetical protein
MISFNFEAQINYMWSLKLFKVSEILCVATFDTICSSKFVTNCVDYSLPTPNATWQCFDFLHDIYYQKNSNQNRNKDKHYAQECF